jgi:hypothetical protein
VLVSRVGQLQPLLCNAQPSRFISRALTSLGLLATFLGLGAELVCGAQVAASHTSNISTILLISQSRSVAFAAIAGVVRSVLWMRTELYYIANSATQCAWFSTFLPHAFVNQLSSAARVTQARSPSHQRGPCQFSRALASCSAASRSCRSRWARAASSFTCHSRRRDAPPTPCFAL